MITSLSAQPIRGRNRRCKRQGIAAVEFALCLPIMMSLTFGVVEASNAVFLQQALTSAAYEAANVASAIGSTSANAQAQANSVLSSLGVRSSTVTITPTITPSTTTGTVIVITCSAPLGSNSIVMGYLGTGLNLTAKITMPHL